MDDSLELDDELNRSNSNIGTGKLLYLCYYFSFSFHYTNFIQDQVWYHCKDSLVRDVAGSPKKNIKKGTTEIEGSL